MFKILVVEDDEELRRLYCTVLRKDGYSVFDACDGEAALRILDREYIDLIVCDIMMPNMDGYELTRELRAVNYDLPILMISAKDRFDDMQEGFRAGVDDYMKKPINVSEMLLRVGALLRRVQSINERRVTVGDTVFEYDSLTVRSLGEEYVLPQKEFFLIYKLISSPNHIFTRQQLMDEIWGMDTETEARTVDVHIGRLRDKFKTNPDFEIVTVRGLGYKAVKKV